MRLFSHRLLIVYFTVLHQCAAAQLSEKTINKLLQAPALQQAHIGVSIYDGSEQKSIYQYQSDKFFTPSSNQKIFTLYAGLHYLKDSLPAARICHTEKATYLQPLGDPSFMHPDFSYQPLLNYLQKDTLPVIICGGNWQDTPLGKGWMWDDYPDEFSAERSALPIHGNVVEISSTAKANPAYFTAFIKQNKGEGFTAKAHRAVNDNLFFLPAGSAAYRTPFITHNGITTANLLASILNKEVLWTTTSLPDNGCNTSTTIHSIAAADLYEPMMRNSDNFFAEQTLLMAAMQQSGSMKMDNIIETTLADKLKGIPHKPQWVDGSGLSRYNLCTPDALVFVLQQLQNDFGLEKMKTIFPTGGEGTIKNYYNSLAGKIFAKTGTMSDNSAFSGYLITRSKKLIIFSLMANNYQTGGRAVRLAFEEFLMGIWNEE